MKSEGARQEMRPKLPLRWPGQNPTITLTESRVPWRPAEADDPVPVAPSFPEAIEAQVKHAMRAYSNAASKQSLSKPHAALTKVLADEGRRKRRRAKDLKAEAPHFSAPGLQRQLRLFSALAHGLATVGARCEVHEHSRDMSCEQRLHMSALVGSVTLLFQFEAVEESGTCTLLLKVRAGSTTVATWECGHRLLARQLKGIVELTLTKAEERLRNWAFELHVHAVKEIEDARRKVHAAGIEKQRQQAERSAAPERARQDALKAEASRWHQAEQLRAYVAAVAERRPESVEWQAWALSVADGMDPLNADGSTFQRFHEHESRQAADSVQTGAP